MKFPTIEEMAQNVAEKALDEYEYNGKTLRQWIEIIATASEDTISRQAAIEAVQNRHMMLSKEKVLLINDLEKLPPAEPQIIRCKDCKHWIPYDWMFSEVWRSKNMADYPEDEIGCNWCDMAMKANDFCSRGEKREVTE